ncbi:MAG TPA: DUF1850 domain-containing protein [Bacillota bacterium]
MKREWKKNKSSVRRTIVPILCILATIIGGCMFPVQSGFMLTNVDGDMYYFFPDDSRKITIGWRHSVELTLWKETYHVLPNGDLSLQSTIYESYGAGTPDIEGTVEVVSDEVVRVTGIQRVMPSYSLYYVPNSHYYIELNRKTYALSDYVPAHTAVQIHYKSIVLYEWLWFKVHIT